MYGALWRVLPGPGWAKALFLGFAAALVVIALFEWGFPWLSSVLPFQETTVE